MPCRKTQAIPAHGFRQLVFHPVHHEILKIPFSSPAPAATDNGANPSPKADATSGRVRVFPFVSLVPFCKNFLKAHWSASMTQARLISPSRLTGACLLVTYAYCAFLSGRMSSHGLDFTDDLHRLAFRWLWILSFLGLLVWDKIFCRTHRSLSLLIKLVFLGSLLALFLLLALPAITHALT